MSNFYNAFILNTVSHLNSPVTSAPDDYLCTSILAVLVPQAVQRTEFTKSSGKMFLRQAHVMGLQTVSANERLSDFWVSLERIKLHILG
ncbi:hypothetical protein AV530_012648 [Patagioenas fasciata monilis]|uniref:Uncharacterized protein n=1 Tax=Patagioenas fasciata monilis TaxID=372326 RepID=A0A1V4JBF5_PATFA|nr:hypothetical protein AV530_012648 [Patagioenas fasciata monilis]